VITLDSALADCCPLTIGLITEILDGIVRLNRLDMKKERNYFITLKLIKSIT
jgi:hypothetical protein